MLVAAKRTPVGRYLGALSKVDPLELAAVVACAALRQARVSGEKAVDRLYAGNCFPSSLRTGSVVGRQLGLRLGLAGFCTTVDTACCSALTALRLAVQGIRVGDFESALVVGLESMSRVPHLARGLREGVRAGALALEDPIYPIEYKGYAPVSRDAEEGAAKYGIDRDAMDRWALRSNLNWADAHAAGRFSDELVPVEVADGKGAVVVDRDEQPRPDTTLEKLASLRPVFGTSCITPGNAPGLNDGASAVVVMSGKRALELGIQPLVRIVACAEAADSPHGMSWVPALASCKALKSANLSVHDLALIEINEAFAAVPLVSTRVLSNGDDALWERLKKITNVNGGAVAIGHPVGASGLRILSTLIYELRRRNGTFGLAAICGGLAQGEAVVVERVPPPS